MGRPRDERRREQLRAAACEYLLRVGVSAAELGEIASEVGTSSRMLIHHFGSKEALIAAAVAEARDRQRTLFQAWFDRRRPRDLPDLVRTLWELMEAPEAQPYLRLFSEVYPLAVQQPERFPGFSTAAAVHDWLPRLEAELRAGGLPEDELSALATLALGVQRGLLLDLLGTGDRERVRTANEALLRRLEQGARG
jgi:AcrR family transcriptional regulator